MAGDGGLPFIQWCPITGNTQKLFLHAVFFGFEKEKGVGGNLLKAKYKPCNKEKMGAQFACLVNFYYRK